MKGSGIVTQVVKLEKTDRNSATHFALYKGEQLRYLIDLHGGKKRLSESLSAYSKSLSLLLRLIDITPFLLLRYLRLGHYVKAELHPEVEKCKQFSKKNYWNMIVGTYDEKQKVVLQCYSQNELAIFIKVGNIATEVEMNAEISFLQNKKKYKLFNVPELIGSVKRDDNTLFNIQMTKEFVGNKVEPILTQQIVDIYHEVSSDSRNGLVFSHGDFAPWNMKKTGEQYILFDWEHCGYRTPGFDLMHFVVAIEVFLNKKSLEDAIESALNKIRVFEPSFDIVKDAFEEEFNRMRK